MAIEIDLAGHSALVTGGGSGIGRETAVLLASAGADVAVLDLDEVGAKETAAAIEALGRRASVLVADVTDADGVAEALAGSVLGAPDIVVNNAFWAAPGPFASATAAADAKTVGVILLGTMTVTKAALPAMVAAGAGCIVNVMSDAGRVGEAGMVAYSAAKAGVGGFTKALAKEVGPAGIRVNAVSPGLTRTPSTAMLDEATIARMVRGYPLGRLGEPSDVASAVLWLVSPLSPWVTGQIVSVSGGYTTAG